MIIDSNLNYPIRICNFYSNPGHLLACALPYIKSLVDNNGKVLFITEQNLDSQINRDSYIYNFSTNTEKAKCFYIDNISEQENQKTIYDCVKQMIKESIDKEVVVIIQGTWGYCASLYNDILSRFSENPLIIVDCYEILSSKKYLKDIISKHRYWLNSSGIRLIDEIYAATPEKNKDILDKYKIPKQSSII